VESWFDSLEGQHFCSFLEIWQLLLGPTQPHIQQVAEIVSPGVKGPGCKTDHSATSSANVNNEWKCISIFSRAFMACVKTSSRLQIPCQMRASCVRVLLCVDSSVKVKGKVR
jgi:hypothetical protein